MIEVRWSATIRWVRALAATAVAAALFFALFDIGQVGAQSSVEGQLVVSIDEQLASTDPRSGGRIAAVLTDDGDVVPVAASVADQVGATTGDRVRLSGTSEELARGTASIAEVTKRAPVQRAADNEHDLAVILVDMTDRPDERPFDRAEVADRIFSDTGGVNGVILESSYGDVRFDGDIDDVYGWYTTLEPPDPNECYAQIEHAFVRDFLALEGVPIAEYEHLLLLLVCDQTAGAVSTLGSLEVVVGDQSCQCSSAYLAYDAFLYETDVWPLIHPTIQQQGVNLLPRLEAVVVHELGHGLGAAHDSHMDCGSASWGTEAECSWFNYGNHLSAMGRGRGIAWTFSAAARDDIGFFRPGGLAEISVDGLVEIGALNDSAAGRPNAVAVVDPVSFEVRHFVELRTPGGFDAGLEFGPPGNEVIVTTQVPPVRGSALVLDGQPGQPLSPWIDHDQVGFLVGTGFTDDLGISMTVVSIADDHAVLSFDFPTPIGTATPTATVVASPTATPWGPLVMPTPTAVPTASATATPTPTPTLSPGTAGIGDVDCDAMVTVADASYALQLAVGSRSDSGGCPLGDPLSEANAVAADANNDNAITVVDANLILQCAVGIGEAC